MKTRISLFLLSSVLVGSAASKAEPSAQMPLVNFTSLASSGFWSPLTDQVRGGQSTAFMQILPDQTAQISGSLSLIDNAGFASFRVARADHQAWDLKGAKSLTVEAAGDGRVYKMLLKDMAAEKSTRDYSWEASIKPDAALQPFVIPLSTFKPVFRGREINDVPPLNKNEIRQMGIQLNDHNAGPYMVRLKSIGAE